jgi:hypothetical protein
MLMFDIVVGIRIVHGAVQPPTNLKAIGIRRGITAFMLKALKSGATPRLCIRTALEADEC